MWLAALLPAVPIAAWSQSRTGRPTADEFTVQVIAMPNTAGIGPRLDLGSVSRDKVEGNRSMPAAATHYTVTRRIQLRVAGRNAGHVNVQAFLLHDCYPCRLKLDGVELSASPKVVFTGVELNKLTDHRLEIDIPVSMAPGAIDAEIDWQVERQ